MEENILQKVYEEGRRRGLFHTKKEFAEALDVNPSTLSQALSGNEKYLSARLRERAKMYATQHFYEKQPHQQEPSPPDITIPAATVELYTAMAKSIDRLTALVERIQATGYNYAQKKLPS